MSQFTGTTFGPGTPSLNPITPGSWGLSPYAGSGVDPFVQQTAPPIQQILHVLQVVPQQLQQLQYLQQQQLVQIQQLLQFVPAQLQQLQQLIQSVPQQIQHLQQRQPLSSAIPGAAGFGFAPQTFSGQPVGQVM